MTMQYSTRSMFRRHAIAALAAFASLFTLPAPSSAQDYAAIIAAPDRADGDRQTDQRRDPVKLLAFTGVKSGMTVLDMGAGGGYSTELMARAVGPGGKVYGQDFETSARAKERFEARMKTKAMTNVVALARPFDDPLPADVANLDLITFFFAYHDTTYMPVDRAEMNKKMFAALKPGGFLIIADHSAKPGAGTSVGKTLHRIEESALRARSRPPACASSLVVISCAIQRGPVARRADLPACCAGRRVCAEVPEAAGRPTPSSPPAPISCAIPRTRATSGCFSQVPVDEVRAEIPEAELISAEAFSAARGSACGASASTRSLSEKSFSEITFKQITQNNERERFRRSGAHFIGYATGIRRIHR